ncbi:MAG: hypothetical protein IKJ39_12485 [Lachnospiraceae bacterium]|nr:hypothetical protein [Lachnospiraceae bacterium]
MGRKKMTKKENRYIRLYSQSNGAINERGTEIWLDRETGISYLFRYKGYEEHFIPLLDEEGKSIVKNIKRDDKGNFFWNGKRVS